MSENDDVNENQPRQPEDRSTEPSVDQPAEQSAPEQAAPVGAPAGLEPKPSWRDRVFGVRSMIAVGLAGLILGAGTATTTALVVDGDRYDHHERTDRPGDRGDFGPGGVGPRNS